MGIFSMITFDDILHWMPVISAIVLVAFDWGIIVQKLKTFVTKDEMEKMMVEKLKGHCPNVAIIRDIDLKVQKIQDWKTEHVEWGAKENEKNHLALLAIQINLQNICDKLEISYYKSNGS